MLRILWWKLEGLHNWISLAPLIQLPRFFLLYSHNILPLQNHVKCLQMDLVCHSWHINIFLAANNLLAMGLQNSMSVFIIHYSFPHSQDILWLIRSDIKYSSTKSFIENRVCSIFQNTNILSIVLFGFRKKSQNMILGCWWWCYEKKCCFNPASIILIFACTRFDIEGLLVKSSTR